MPPSSSLPSPPPFLRRLLRFTLSTVGIPRQSTEARPTAEERGRFGRLRRRPAPPSSSSLSSSFPSPPPTTTRWTPARRKAAAVLLTAAAGVVLRTIAPLSDRRLASLTRRSGGGGGTTIRAAAAAAAKRDRLEGDKDGNEDSDDVGRLDVSPLGLEGRCASVRFARDFDEGRSKQRKRRRRDTMTVEEARGRLFAAYAPREGGGDDDQGSKSKQRRRRRRTSPLLIGLEFAEGPGWTSLSPRTLSFHAFHFLEFLVVSYAELHRLGGKGVGSHPDLSSNATMTFDGGGGGDDGPSLSRLSTPMSVPWIYVPLMARGEVCGVGGGINCRMADVVLHASSERDGGGIVVPYGLECNDDETVRLHPSFGGLTDHRKRRTELPGGGGGKGLPLSSSVRRSNRDDMTAGPLEKDGSTTSLAADAVLLVNRNGCDHGRINKMWAGYLNNGAFPADQWHQDVRSGLGLPSLPPTTTGGDTTAAASRGHKNKVVVGYVDRQNTKRIMPPGDHTWLMRYLSDHPDVYFRHLRMEEYDGLEQMRQAATCDVLIGVHGNGLSHVLWMRPNRYVIEVFWDYRFQYDYASAAQLMGHRYLALFNGKPVDDDAVRRRDPALMYLPHRISWWDRLWGGAKGGRFGREGQAAIRSLIKDAVEDIIGGEIGS